MRLDAIKFDRQGTVSCCPRLTLQFPTVSIPPKALLTMRRWFCGGCFMRGGKYYFSVSKHDLPSRGDDKPPVSKSDKTSRIERKIVKRPKTFKTDDWYKEATLSLAISAKP
jgi:hypothetical protein